MPQRTPWGKGCRPRASQALMLLSFLPQGKISDPFRFTTFYIYFALVLSALVLSCSREKPPFFSPKNIDPVSLNGGGWWWGCHSPPLSPALTSIPHPFQFIPSSCHLHSVHTGTWSRKERATLLPLLCLERVVCPPDVPCPTLAPSRTPARRPELASSPACLSGGLQSELALSQAWGPRGGGWGWRVGG